MFGMLQLFQQNTPTKKKGAPKRSSLKDRIGGVDSPPFFNLLCEDVIHTEDTVVLVLAVSCKTVTT